jgi:hypothetical protein
MIETPSFRHLLLYQDDFTQLYTTPDGKFKSGYYISNNNFAMQLEVINYRKEAQQVYVETDLEYVPGRDGGDAEQGVLSAKGEFDCKYIDSWVIFLFLPVMSHPGRPWL